MTIELKDPRLFAPIVESVVQVDENPVDGVTTTETVNGFEYEVISFDASDIAYQVSGINMEDPVFSSTPPEALGTADGLTIRGAEGFSGYATVLVSNGKASVSIGRRLFGTSGGGDTVGQILDVTAGSYAEFSRDIMIALADAVPNKRIIAETAPYYRTNLATFPHAQLTGVCWGTYGPLQGRKPTAITAQHVVNAGHYMSGGLVPGTVCTWLTADNQVVTRTVVERYNPGYDTNPRLQIDIEVAVLDSPLPESIVPVSIAGPWFWGITSATAAETTYLPLRGFGIMIWGNDGTWSPRVSRVIRGELTSTLRTNTYGFDSRDGPFLSPMRFSAFNEYGRPDLHQTETNSDPDAKFAHWMRQGDSGCPMLCPVADGVWMLVDSGQATYGLSEDLYNFLIGKADEAALTLNPTFNGGDPTGLTVTVAADPTL